MEIEIIWEPIDIFVLINNVKQLNNGAKKVKIHSCSNTIGKI